MLKKAIKIVEKAEQVQKTKKNVSKMEAVQNTFKDFSPKEKILKFNEDYRQLPNKEEGNPLFSDAPIKEQIGDAEITAPNVEPVKSSNVKETVKDLADAIPRKIPLNIPKGAIAILLILILFILMAVRKIDTKDGGSYSQLSIMWRALLGKATLTNEEQSKEEKEKNPALEILGGFGGLSTQVITNTDTLKDVITGSTGLFGIGLDKMLQGVGN